MKKVVLLAGAVAAGMAVAPQAANAAIPEINDVQEINLTNDQITTAITKAQAELTVLETLQGDPYYATAVSTGNKNAIQQAVEDLTNLVNQMTLIVNGQTSPVFATNSYTHNYNYYYSSTFGKGTLVEGYNLNNTTYPYIYRYRGNLTYNNTNRSTCADVVNAAIASVENGTNSVVKQAQTAVYKAHNSATEANIKATDDYKHLVEILKEADDIYDGTNDLYKDEDTYKELKQAQFDAHLKDGAMESARNLIAAVEGASDVDDELVSEYDLMTLISTVSPELEGLINTFKIAANKAAYDKIAEYVDGFTHVNAGDTDPVADGKLTKIKKELQHHLNTSANCLNKDAHNIFDDASDVTAAEGDLADLLAGFEPDKGWNDMGHNPTNPDIDPDRALNDPKAVKKWKDIQDQMANTNWEDKTNPVDVQLTKIRTIIYQTCLIWDKEDINSAIEKLNTGTDYLASTTNFQGGSVTVSADDSNTGSAQTVTVVSELKDWLVKFLNQYPAAITADTKGATDTYIEESIADEYWDCFHGGTTKGSVAALLANTVVTPSDFATGETAVDKLANTIANVKANWADFVTLDNNLVARRLEMEAAAKKKGYDSKYIADQWGASTTTDFRDVDLNSTAEWNHHETLRKAIKDAINAINDKAANAGEWVGVGVATDPASFAGKNALEEDHHKWLAQYQQENYDAKESLLDAIEVRFAEYEKVASFAITSDDPENPMELADKTKLYTTNTNKGVQLQNILGEDNTSANIYKDKFFAEIAEHFGNGDNTVDAASSIVKDGKPVDLKNDLITKWYNDGEAQYIVKQTYDAAWNAEGAARYGKLKDNTVEGLQVTTSATDASGILVFAPEATAAGKEVVFGWLQKEIQKAFKEAVENEKANKDIHDKIKEANDYIAAGKALINTKANINVTADDVKARDYTTYDMENRKDVIVSESAYTADNWLNHEGEYLGDKANNYDVTDDLNADYYGKEEYSLVPTNYSIDYLAEFECGHYKTETPNDKVWGWTKLEKVMADLETLEKHEYDNVASKALFDGTTTMNLDGDSNNETFTETLTEVKENVDDITNEAFTQLYKNGLALVQEELNKAKTWAKSLDDKCHEDPALDTACSAEDVKNNPCGWDNTSATDDDDAYNLLKNIVDAWNTERKLIVSEHNTEANDTYDTTSDPNVKKVDDFNAYLIGALNAIRDWKAKFAEMDKAHKIALNAALDEATSAATTGRTFAEIAKLDKASFTDADKAVAELWAKDFNTRSFTFLDNTAYTFTELLAKLEANIKKAHNHVDEPLDDDKYKELERVIADGIATFDDYIYATEIIDQLCVEYATALHKAHSYTELKTFSEGLKKFNLESDYMEAINANNAAYVELQKKLGDAQTELNAAKNNVETDKNEVYFEDYTALTTTHLQDAQKVLDDQQKAIEAAWLAGKAADHIEVVKDVRTEVKGYALDLKKNADDTKDVIEVYVDKAQEAKNLYATNKLAKEELLRQVDAVLIALTADREKADFTGGDQCMSENKTRYDALETTIKALKTSVNGSFDKKFDATVEGIKSVETLQGEVNGCIEELGQIEKAIADYNTKVLASDNAAKNLNNMIDAAFAVDTDTDGNLIPDGEKMKEAMVEGYLNFQVRPAAPAIYNTEVKYFNQILDDIDDLKAQIATDNGHVTTDGEGGHVVAEKYADYLKEMDKIQKALDDLVEAINKNEAAYKNWCQKYAEDAKTYECYEVAENTAAEYFSKIVNALDPDKVLGDLDHSLTDGVVEGKYVDYKQAIDDCYHWGALSVEAEAPAKTAADEKIEAARQDYLDAVTAAEENSTKFIALYNALNYGNVGKDAEGNTLTWEDDILEWFSVTKLEFVNERPADSGTINSLSDVAEANVNSAKTTLGKKLENYLKDIKEYWYAGTIVAWAKGEGTTLAGTDTYANRVAEYNEAFAAYNQAVADAQDNDAKFIAQKDAHVVKELTAEATYTDTRVATDGKYTALQTQLNTLLLDCNKAKYDAIRADIIEDWELELSVDENSANNAAIDAYQKAAAKYNALMANLNAYGAQLVKYFEQVDALEEAKLEIYGNGTPEHPAMNVMTSNLKDVDDDKDEEGKPVPAADYDAKSVIEGKIDAINNELSTLKTNMETAAGDVAATTIDSKNVEDYPTNTLNVVGNAETVPSTTHIANAIDALSKYAAEAEAACNANEEAFKELYEKIKANLAQSKKKDDFKGEKDKALLEAYERIADDLIDELEGLKQKLAKAYLDEEAVKYLAEKGDRIEEIMKDLDTAWKTAKDLVGGKLGDLNADEKFNEWDLAGYDDMPGVIDLALAGVYDERGDFDLNAAIDVTDVTLAQSYLWYGDFKNQRNNARGTAEFEASTDLVVAGNTVALALNNNCHTNGIQFDVLVPAGAKLTSAVCTARAEGFNVVYRKYAADTYRVIVIPAVAGAVINDNEGNLVSFNVSGEGEVEVFNVIATDGASHYLNGGVVTLGNVTAIDEVAAEGETDIFSLDGIRQSVMKAGVNIVRGANGAVKKIFNK